MRWLTNLYDPRLPDASQHVVLRYDESSWDGWDRQKEWLKDKIIAEPKATPSYTVEQLQAMKMVGVYAREERP